MAQQLQEFQPYIDESVDPHVRTLMNLIFNKINNHARAISAVNAKAIGGTSTTIVQETGSSGGGGGGSSTAVFGINNQTGVTAYTTQPGDNGVLLVLSDAAAIAVTLSTGITAPWGIFVANQGTGTATLTPSAGTISYAGNPGAASMTLFGGYCAIIAFDGANFWAFTEPIVPVTFGAVAHEWLNSYNASTGQFTATQPAFSDISGTASTAQIGTGTPAAGKYVDGAAGAWTALPAQPLSGTSGSMGGSAMTAGQTISTTVTITGASSGMVATTSPEIYPGDGFVWDAYVSAANTVTVRLTATLAGTPTASVYAVRIVH